MEELHLFYKGIQLRFYVLKVFLIMFSIYFDSLISK